MNQVMTKNFYKMLCYVYEGLNRRDFEECSNEYFDNVIDLYGALLAVAVGYQIKKGLYKEYKSVNDDLGTVKGKINIYGTIKNCIKHNNKVSCDYDELTVNNVYNQIIKSTMLNLIRNALLDKKISERLRKELFYLNDISEIRIDEIEWNRLHYSKTNYNYEVMINMCRLLIDSLLQNKSGEISEASIIGKNEEYIFENFIFNYYKKHYSKVVSVTRDHIEWDASGDTSLLPIMKTDIVLTTKNYDLNRKLVIDAKYYNVRTLQNNYGIDKIRNSHLYQVFTYLHNFKASKDNKNYEIRGMLLYSRLDRSLNEHFRLSNFDFRVKTLAIDVDFTQVKKQLDSILDEFIS